MDKFVLKKLCEPLLPKMHLSTDLSKKIPRVAQVPMIRVINLEIIKPVAPHRSSMELPKCKDGD